MADIEYCIAYAGLPPMNGLASNTNREHSRCVNSLKQYVRHSCGARVLIPSRDRAEGSVCVSVLMPSRDRAEGSGVCVSVLMPSRDRVEGSGVCVSVCVSVCGCPHGTGSRAVVCVCQCVCQFVSVGITITASLPTQITNYKLRIFATTKRANLHVSGRSPFCPSTVSPCRTTLQHMICAHTHTHTHTHACTRTHTHTATPPSRPVPAEPKDGRAPRRNYYVNKNR